MTILMPLQSVPILLSLAHLFTGSKAVSQTAETRQVPNYSGSVVCSASQLVTASSVEDIQVAVRGALISGLPLKVRSIEK